MKLDPLSSLIYFCSNFRDLKEYNVLGFDCEWVSTTRRGPVALLQLATHRGVCALIRLSHMDIIPLELQVKCFVSVENICWTEL